MGRAFFIWQFCGRKEAERRQGPPLFLLQNWAMEVVEKMSFTQSWQGYNPGQMMQPGYSYGQQPQQMQQSGGLSGRMVTSREEALATPVDFLAGMTFLPDMSHGRIYVKIFDRNTGGANTVEFIPAPQVEKAEENPLEERVRRLEEEIENAKRRGAMAASRRGAGEYGRHAAADGDYPEQRQPRPAD